MGTSKSSSIINDSFGGTRENSSMVERCLAKAEAEGSSPFFRYSGGYHEYKLYNSELTVPVSARGSIG